jgi:hypothetical protein
MADPKRSEYMRDYMRQYMRRKRAAADGVARSDPLIGPPCPPNLPAGEVTTGRLTRQARLFKAQLAFALSQSAKVYEELNLKVETFYLERLEYEMQLTDAEAKVAELEAKVQELEAKLAQVSTNLPTPQPSPSSPGTSLPEAPKPDLDQYMLDKAQGFVDPDRKPTPADDHIPDW